MKKRTDKSILDAGLYLSHMNYYATGEGVRSCLAIGGDVPRFWVARRFGVQSPR